jgi:hypothetical protein
MTRGIVALLGLAFACACSDDAGGPEYIVLGVSISTGSDAVIGELCTRLPVLLGSQVLDRALVEGRLTVEVRATREGAEVRFPGAEREDTLARSLSAATLRAGYSESIALEAGGGTYTATLSSGCSTP